MHACTIGGLWAEGVSGGAVKNFLAEGGELALPHRPASAGKLHLRGAYLVGKVEVRTFYRAVHPGR